MKLRLLALSAVLLTLSYASPRGWAQDKDGATTPTPDTAAKSTAPTPVTAADPDKVKHEGGKGDVDAIGNRNVGCKTGMGNWYGVEKQIAMGKQYAQQVESSEADPGPRGDGICKPGGTESGAQLRCPGPLYHQGHRLR